MSLGFIPARMNPPNELPQHSRKPTVQAKNKPKTHGLLIPRSQVRSLSGPSENCLQRGGFLRIGVTAVALAWD